MPNNENSASTSGTDGADDPLARLRAAEAARHLNGVPYVTEATVRAEWERIHRLNTPHPPMTPERWAQILEEDKTAAEAAAKAAAAEAAAAEAAAQERKAQREGPGGWMATMMSAPDALADQSAMATMMSAPDALVDQSAQSARAELLSNQPPPGSGQQSQPAPPPASAAPLHPQPSAGQGRIARR
ncbi:hypothetical protein [Streptomyces sp. NPDC047061]|uniref:hypothetical protein n=1 Tax=Streptomyces sp. NPDC047061 TaxID=3154605 RepID=UPI00340298BD